MNKPIQKMLKNQSGFAMTSTTLFIFIVISIFAVYLTRFTFTSQRSSSYLVQETRARNLSQTGIDIALDAVSTNYNQLRTDGFSGRLNKGSYDATLDEDNFEDGATLPYHHFSVIESTGKLAEVKRRSRVLVSSYPNAFNLSFFNENFGNATFSSPSSTFNDDIYVNGNVNQLNLGSSAIGYSSLTSPSSPMVSHGVPLPEFPSHDPSYFTSVLGTVNGEWESGTGGGGETGSATQKIWNPNGGHCNVCGSGQRYACSNGYGGWSNSHTFNDFVPSGSTLISVIVKFYASGPCGGTWNVTPSLNSQQIGTLSWYNSRCWCNACDQNTLYGGTYNDGFPNYNYGGNNTLTLSHSGQVICVHSIDITLEYAAGSSPGEADGETISLTNFSNNTLMHDGDLSFTGCTINGPGTIVASGDITMNGNTVVGPNVTIISGQDVNLGGSTTIANSIQDYAVIYSGGELSVTSSNISGLIIAKGSNTSINSSTINGAIHIESSTVSISNANINGALVTKYSPSITSSTVTKGNLPDIFDTNLGFEPSVVSGSFLEF